METVVFYNAGKLARMEGKKRVAPSSYNYPIVSRYEPYREQEVRLCDTMKKYWYEGFDGKYDR